MTHHIDFGSKRIEFSIVFADRKTLGISVTPEANVLVKAPVGSDIGKVQKIVSRKAPWILKQQTFFLGFHPKTQPRQYRNGETHLYMGREYRLRITQAPKNDLHFTGRELIVQAKPGASVKHILNEWYKERAKMKFAELAEPLIQRFEKYNVRPSSVYILEMPHRWGSCTPKGKIILNPELIKAPKVCIEYVITHELCHLVHKNHTTKFFQLQKKEMPDWEKWKTKLETLLA